MVLALLVICLWSIYRYVQSWAENRDLRRLVLELGHYLPVATANWDEADIAAQSRAHAAIHKVLSEWK